MRTKPTYKKAVQSLHNFVVQKEWDKYRELSWAWDMSGLFDKDGDVRRGYAVQMLNESSAIVWC